MPRAVCAGRSFAAAHLERLARDVAAADAHHGARRHRAAASFAPCGIVAGVVGPRSSTRRARARSAWSRCRIDSHSREAKRVEIVQRAQIEDVVAVAKGPLRCGRPRRRLAVEAAFPSCTKGRERVVVGHDDADGLAVACDAVEAVERRGVGGGRRAGRQRRSWRWLRRPAAAAAAAAARPDEPPLPPRRQRRRRRRCARRRRGRTATGMRRVVRRRCGRGGGGDGGERRRPPRRHRRRALGEGGGAGSRARVPSSTATPRAAARCARKSSATGLAHGKRSAPRRQSANVSGVRGKPVGDFGRTIRWCL